ncbi:bifunctional 4-hydroxy-2-oxoglutarate aldolase/2-dehydro-3-deoxy-phosphogluconate aldolase [Alkalibacter rhizosphaerae]|uniref:2-dehydro-3-deoxy-phosphogluconate aldolase n=1 Tax=Alkalibacter rhizosphaerae TaxID=2815577 RepID=A0A974XG19_9FIRM|nr:bifunctional 4-hydroxy-2-oxoglutarate aldolase/2-dehydro-3-deoxy-phosphogluconate aldolase [Alkalibacter rhizosphaerae]QSX09194.1 bifunctional 4-hydroxy-2-oxoglutarate aldolase/2-dehydro-3-deoxy-phosphogluconate aldolase [Alkalibacter rhizosphaerae]
MNDVLKKIQQIGIVPVVKLDRVEDALPLAKALMEGGLPCAEVTFRTDAAKDSIKVMSDTYPEMLIGAGTVLTKQQVDDAVEAGATFIVSPGLNPEIVKYCVDKGILIVPGCSNPSDVEQAISFGLDVVKFFPAEASGGLAMIKAMAAPYVNMKFMPTGGVNEKNLKSYLDFPKIVACGGSWMVSADLINEGKFDEIKKITKKAVQEMLGFELGHIGINGDDEGDAEKIASRFELLFGFEKKVGNSSIFAGDGIEVTKKPYLGEKGHIAIKTNYINRAVAYMEANGFDFDMDTAKHDAKGKLTAVYLKETFGGFALHLVQKK